MVSNPLQGFFRQPGIHVKLPTNGYYNAEGTFDFSPNREVGIYPMTAADEMVATNPDSLLNGSALERIVASCCPSLTNPKEVLIQDADVIILAAKSVSFGDALHLKAQCPKCQKLNDFTLSIRSVLEQVTPFPKQHVIRLSDELVAHLRPFTLRSNNLVNLRQFEETKHIQNILENKELSDEVKSREVSQAYDRMANVSLEMISECVMKIITPQAEVTDIAQIKEFLDNSSRVIVKKVRDGLEEFTKYGLPKETDVVCSNEKCTSVWRVPIVYDPSSFFASDS
jgi:phage FluMu protein Com